MAKSKIGSDGWPTDQREPLSFSDLCVPLIDAIRFAYKMERQNGGESIPWNGPNIGSQERATCLDAKHQLSAEQLAYSDEDQGRDALVEIIGLALRLGIEQGRRIFRKSPEYSMLVMKAASVDHKEGKITDQKFAAALKGEYDVFD